MSTRWELIDTLLGGTEAMRQAGQVFLPQYEKESNKHWQQRLDRNVLTNMIEMTSDHLVGQALKVAPQPDEDVPDAIVELLEDVDGQGTGFPVFAHKIFKDGIEKAFTHVLIDYPSTNTFNADGEPRTLADDRAENLRPYWVHIPPENLFFAHSAVINGREVLTQIRFFEMETEIVGWEEVFYKRIRVLQRVGLESGKTGVEWQLWEEREIKGKKKEWVQIGGGLMDVEEIPLVTFYTTRDGFMVGKPPLTDLAHLNVAHWQSTSDQRNVLTVSRFPILAASGALSEDTEGKITVGPHSFLFMPDPQGKFYYVEHDGKAIEAGRLDLKDLEEQMANYGAEFLKKRPANEGVTARVLDTSENLSALQVWILDFKDALENMLMFTAQWMKLDDGGSIMLDSDDVGLSEADTTHLDAIDKARKNKDISRKAYLEELKRRSVLSEEFDIEEDAAERESEAPSPELSMFGPGGQPIQPGSSNPLDPNNPDDNEDPDA
jgi:hypothetical protein